MSKYVEHLFQFLNQSPTAFHAVDQIAQFLDQQSYRRLDENQPWDLAQDGRYYVVRNMSSIIAFRIPKVDFKGFMITASHSDSPTFKLKEDPEIVEHGYTRLNVEKYGGMLCAPWFDRPLSIAGRVLVRTNKGIETKLVNIDQDLLMIPHLAIHMDREANRGHEYNVQKEMLPIIGDEQAKGKLWQLIAEQLHVQVEDIVSHDLFLYPRQNCTLVGAQQEYMVGPRFDDLECTFANVFGFMAANDSESVPVCAVFDNEEVGSTTKQGANSTFLQDVLSRIDLALGHPQETYYQHVTNSFMVSADNAHAIHPAYMEKTDPVNRPKMNQGIVIKYSANQRYTTDGVSASVFKEILKDAGVSYQTFTNRSDMLGGSTLGNISNTHVSLNTVDIGLAQLAMHSCYEMAGSHDLEMLVDGLAQFFSTSMEVDSYGNISLCK